MATTLMSVDKAAKSSCIQAKLDGLDAQLMELKETMNTLECSLEPVLLNLPSSAANERPVTTPPPMSPVASQIDTAIQRVSHIAANIRDLMERLEV